MAQSGNGVDLAAVYQLMLGMSGRLDKVSERLDKHEQKLDEMAVSLQDLRAAVTNYHVRC